VNGRDPFQVEKGGQIRNSNSEGRKEEVQTGGREVELQGHLENTK